MVTISFSLYLLLIVPSVWSYSSIIDSKFQEAGIIPNIIDAAPSQILKVTYPSGAVVNLGNELTPTQVKDQPTLHWDADENALYTVVLSDINAPLVSEVRHWLCVNIPGNKVSEGQTVLDYIGSGPPLGSGKHCYVFLVFKQSYTIKTNVYISKTTKNGRTKTKARDLIKEYNLGDPVAGNFYRAEFDDYVPIFHAGFTN